MQKSEHKKLAYFEGWISIVVNVVLFALKFWAGFVTGSIAMMADAWHTLSDSFTSVVVIIGYWVSSKPADKNHPFGHGRAEFISSIIIGVLLGTVGFNFFIESFKDIISHKTKLEFALLPLIVFSISIFLKEALTQIALWIAKKINSSSVKADAWHHRSDAIASLIIVIAMIFGKKIWWLDGALGILVSILIIHTAYSIIKQAANVLMGEAHDEKIEEEIKKSISKITDEIVNIHHIHIHSYGDHTELTVHVCMPSNMNIKDSHDITKKIESVLKERFSMETTVHVEPIIEK